jgi:intein/homing endonuclease
MNIKKLAELIGILLGDGSLSLKENNLNLNNRLKISFNSRDDSEYISYVRNLLQELFKIEPRLKYRKGENTADLFIFKKEIILFLVNKVGLKLSPKWNKAVIPKKFMSNNLDILVLRGYFDTDGCLVTTNNNGIIYPRLEMKISPSPMQNQFIKILEKYDFNFGVYGIGKGKVRIQMNGKTQLEKWVKLVGFSNQKHLDKLKRFT